MYWEDMEFFSSNKFQKIISILDNHRKLGENVYPPREDILNAYAFTPLENVKVVIFGQDPYHQASPQYASGLAFGVRDGVSPLPKSLVNIFRELEDDTGINRTNGNLSDWAEQGVLLLNSSLTVIEGRPGSHRSLGWGILIKDSIQLINEYTQHVVFILWGRHAQEYEGRIDINKHYIIKSAHPSPFSANRGFFGSKPFSRTNKYLVSHGIEPIRW